MNPSISQHQHQVEIDQNRLSWERKPLLRRLYQDFYARISKLADATLPGAFVEIGSGMGNLKSFFPQAISTDLFLHSWLDVVCDGYELPFRSGSVSHLVLFDVFHHIEAPRPFFREARRVLIPRGRLIVLDPYISAASSMIYGWLHHEPVGWNRPINAGMELPRPRNYYAAQGNATRAFFRRELPALLEGWSMFHREAFACFAYLLSGGFSKRAVYPGCFLPALTQFDRVASRFPRCLAGRCLVGLEKQ
jgi:SAM-dependent methyltransferase